MFVAIIGDIISSKKIERRNEVQTKLNHILKEVNLLYKDDIQASFLITLGDEFQGLLKQPHNVLKIIEFIQFNMHPVKLRFGIGIGDIDTDFTRNDALGADGPAYHKARQMVEELKSLEKTNKSQCTSIKLSLDKDKDMEVLINSCLNGISYISRSWTDKQKEVIIELLKGKHIGTLAEEMELAPSSIYRRLNSSGYYDYTSIRDTITRVLDNKWGEFK